MTTGFRGGGTSIRVGADITPIGEVADSVARFGDRYLHRVYTAHEISCCIGTPEVAARALAARFAAKEATIKVLRPIGHQPDWRSMEVRKDPGGWCHMALSGHAADLVSQAGIMELEVSLTHDDNMAAAVVVAVCGGSDSLGNDGDVTPSESRLSGAH